MEKYTNALRTAMVDAYPSYVASVLISRHIEVTEVIADSIIEGTQVLDGLLANLEATPAALQRHSPLELFRESLRPVTRALDTIDAQEVPRDPEQIALIPWDRYSLAPASTSEIDPNVHDALVAWGVAKAASLDAIGERREPQRPLVWYVCRDGDAEALEREGERVGYRMLPAPQPDHPVVVLIDIAVDDAPQLVVRAVDDGLRVIVFGDDIDDIRATGLLAAGAWKISSRDDVLHRLGTILPILG